MLRQESVRIAFHRISKCGFYAFAKDVPEFSSFDDVLGQLQQWTNGIDLSLTKIADPGGSNQHYPIYLLSIEQSDKEWVFATWNEVPSNETGVASVSLNSKVGAPEVHMNAIQPNSIPGYATYFWVLPELGVMASVRFQHMASGVNGMQKYISRFMSSYMRYVVQGKDNEGNDAVIGYTDAADGEIKKVRPYFKVAPFIKPGPRDSILKNHARIRKVVRRGHVSTLNSIDRAWWQSTIRFLRGSKAAATQHHAVLNQSAYVELEYQPTLSELNLMISTEEDDIETSGWDDMGFVMQGEPNKTYWLGRDLASGSFDLTIDRIDEEVIDLKSLLNALQTSKAQILQLLN